MDTNICIVLTTLIIFASIIILTILSYKFSCKHDWVDIEKFEAGTIFNNFSNAIVYTQQCSKCKEIRSYKIYASGHIKES